MRLFFALDPDPACREVLRKARDAATPHAPTARWVSAESFHLTLVFVGDLADAQVLELRSAGAAVAGRHEPLPLALGQAGTFGRPPRVLWLGVDGGAALAALQADVASAVRGLGVTLEERAYSPHLTLARGRSPRGEPRLLDAARELTVPETRFVARELVLYRSDRPGGGPAYSALTRTPLGGAPPDAETRSPPTE